MGGVSAVKGIQPECLAQQMVPDGALETDVDGGAVLGCPSAEIAREDGPLDEVQVHLASVTVCTGVTVPEQTWL